jgi:hypothetical protein
MPPTFQHISSGLCHPQSVSYPSYSQTSNYYNLCSLGHRRLCTSPPVIQCCPLNRLPQLNVESSQTVRVIVNINLLRSPMPDQQLTFGCSQPASIQSTELSLATRVKLPDSVPPCSPPGKYNDTSLRASPENSIQNPLLSPSPIPSNGSNLKPNIPQAITLWLANGQKRAASTQSFFRNISEVISKLMKGQTVNIQDFELNFEQIEVILTFLVRKFNIQAREMQVN